MLPRHIKTAEDLETSQSATAAGFVEQAIEKNRLAVPYIDEAKQFSAALERATEGLEPPTDELASSWYRREVAPVHLRRLLLGEVGR